MPIASMSGFAIFDRSDTATIACFLFDGRLWIQFDKELLSFHKNLARSLTRR